MTESGIRMLESIFATPGSPVGGGSRFDPSDEMNAKVEEERLESPYRISGAVTRILLGSLEALGIDGDTVCARAGLNRAELSDSSGLISSSQLVRLWHAAAELSDDSLLGLHAAESMQWPPSNILWALSVSGKTLGESLRKAERYSGLLADRPWHRIDAVGDEAHSLLPGLCEYLPSHAEYVMTIAQRALDTCSDEPLTAKEVRFKHRYRGGRKEYDRIFRCQVRFAQDCCGFIFSKSTWNAPIAGWDPTWAKQLEICAVDAGALLEARGFVLSVRGTVQRLLLSGECDIETTAKKLGISDRTLQRRLQEEGTTFRKVVDDSRLYIVQQNRERGMPPERAIQRAGFADNRAYRRALRRWQTASKPG